jgi:hypothetical protein
MFGAVYYLTNDQLATLCRNLLSGVLQREGIFIVSSLKSEPQGVIEANGFRLIRTVSAPKPKNALSLVSNLVLAAAFTKTLLDYREHTDVRAFMEVTQNPGIRALYYTRIPFIRRLFSMGFWIITRLLGVVTQSTFVYRMGFIFGTEDSDIFVFGRSSGARDSGRGESCAKQ